jgi:hypothetical protein
MSVRLVTIFRHGKRDGARYVRIRKQGTNLTFDQLEQGAWKQLKNDVLWPSFFIYYRLGFKKGVECEYNRD